MKCSKCNKDTSGYKSNIITGKSESYCEECWDSDNPFWVIPLYLITVVVLVIIAVVFGTK